MNDMERPNEIQDLIRSNLELAALIPPLKALLAIEQNKDVGGRIGAFVDELKQIGAMLEAITAAQSTIMDRQAELLSASEKAMPGEIVAVLGLLYERMTELR